MRTVEAELSKLRGLLLRYGQHDSTCDALQPMWHKGPCDCGWTATCQTLGINEEDSGMPPETYDGKERWGGGKRVDIGAVPELVALAVEGPLTAGARARWLVERGYRQAGRRYCTVARLPEGMDGKQALRAAFNGDREADWIDRLTDDAAGNHFRRVYAYYTGAPLVLELDRETFRAFLAAGGKAA